MGSSRSALTVPVAMAIKARDVPAIIVERIQAAHPARAYFSAGETNDWPVGVLPTLMKQGAIVEADRASAVDCPGCEWQCHKNVEVHKAGSVTRAFVMCDEEPDHGRITVPLVALRRFVTDLRVMSNVIAHSLDIGPPRVSQGLASYALGTIKGRQGTRQILMSIEDAQLVLGVGRQREPMARVLVWGNAGLTVDTQHVSRLADRKERAAQQRQYTLDRSRQTARKNTTRQRDRAIARAAEKRYAQGGMTWTAIAAELAGTAVAPGLTDKRVRRIIADQRKLERKNLRSKHQTPK